MCSLKIMKKLKFLLPDKNWSDMMDITVITNYGYNGYKGYNSYKGYNRYNGFRPSAPLRKGTFSLYGIRKNCHFLNHPTTPMSLRNT